MPETLTQVFAPTHTLNGVPVMRNPDWVYGHGLSDLWIDSNGETYGSGKGSKANPISREELPAITLEAQGGAFGASYGVIGEKIPTEWWLAHYAHTHSQKGVMVTREAAATALRACAWPDSSAPCGQAGNSNDDDASFEGYDRDGNCIVRLFMRGKGYVKVRIPRTMFLEIVDE